MRNMQIRTLRIKLRQIPIAIKISPLLLMLIGFGHACLKSIATMREFSTSYPPGTQIHILHSKAGEPTQILGHGGKLKHATAGHIIPELDPHTEVHFYAREGIPYYNVYAYVDSRTRGIRKVEVENLWW